MDSDSPDLKKHLQLNLPVVTAVDDDNTLDLHLDISLPAIAESPEKPNRLLMQASPAGGHPSALLMSDERELLKDLQCFEDADSARKTVVSAGSSALALKN